MLVIGCKALTKTPTPDTIRTCRHIQNMVHCDSQTDTHTEMSIIYKRSKSKLKIYAFIIISKEHVKYYIFPMVMSLNKKYQETSLVS